MKRPFSSLKVIEYGENISAPYCAKLMAGLGAEVIKVENTASGDKARINGRFLKTSRILRKAACSSPSTPTNLDYPEPEAEKGRRNLQAADRDGGRIHRK